MMRFLFRKNLKKKSVMNAPKDVFLNNQFEKLIYNTYSMSNCWKKMVIEVSYILYYRCIITVPQIRVCDVTDSPRSCFCSTYQNYPRSW